MSAVRAPTLLIGVGRFAARVLDRVEADVAALGDTPVRIAAVAHGEMPRAELDRLRTHVADLLRVKLGTTRARLDVAVVADLAEAESARTAVVVVKRLGDVLATDFAGVFRPDAPRDQRAICAVPILALPASMAGDLGGAACRAVSDLEVWARAGGPGAIVSRIQLLARQHEAGVMEEEDLVRAAYLFATTMWLSGLRDTEGVRERVEHPRDSGRIVSAFNAAAADVPIDRLVRYFAARTALRGLDILDARCEIAERQARHEDAAAAGLRFASWIEPFEEGAPAQAARRRAMGAGAARVAVHERGFPWHTSNARVRASLESLLAARVADPPSLPDGPGSDDDAVVALDRAEFDAISTARRDIETCVRDRLPASDGLRDLSALDRELEAATAWLRARAKADTPAPATVAETVAAVGDEAAYENLRDALAARPEPARVAGLAVAMAAIAALLGAGITLAWEVKQVPPRRGLGPAQVRGGAPEAGDVATMASWAAVLGSAGLAFGGFVHGIVPARRLRRAAAAARAAGESAGAAGRSRAMASRAAEEAIALRRRRVAAALADDLESWRGRLAGLRAAVREARDAARRALVAAGSDARGALGAEAPLHRHLLPPEAVDTLWEPSRQTREPEAWAGRLLERAWPVQGIATDLPFGDETTWITACREEHASLVRTGIFAWQGIDLRAVSEAVARFLSGVGESLGLGIAPLDERGDAVPDGGSAGFLVVAGQEGRGIVQRASQALQLAVDPMFTEKSSSAVVVVRTHPGFAADDLERGARAHGRA